MARLSKTQVFEAIAAIQLNGDKPTSKVLLDYFGCGSYSTFTKYLREYDLESAGSELSGSSLAVILPEPLQHSLSSFASNLWTTALRSAEEGVELEKRHYEELKQRNQKQLDDAISFADQMQSEMKQLTQLTEEREQRIADLGVQLEREKTSIVRLEVEAQCLRDNLAKSDLTQQRLLIRLTGSHYLSSDVHDSELPKQIDLNELSDGELPF